MPGKKKIAKKTPKSQAQVRMAYATVEGAKTGMPKSVAKEFIAGAHGKKVGKLPKKIKAKK